MSRPYKFGDVVKDWHELHWSSDWNGYEVVEAWQDEEGEE